jgi:winged helix DNA-binding protein
MWPVPPKTLDRRTLNRTFLARQLLLERADFRAAEALEHLVGMQAQSPQAPYIGLWSRLADFDPDELAQLLLDRRAVRIALMRSTIHLVTARDCLALRPLVQSVSERSLGGNYGRQLAGMDLDELAAAGCELVEEAPRTAGELEPLLARRWPRRDPHALAMGVRAIVPLVQVPPRGIWRRSGSAAHTSAESWLGRPLAARPSVERMFVRYLAAFGPASARDAQTWSGLTRLGEVAERLRPKLRTYRDENGVELFDVPEGRPADPDVPAPPRFLPEYDNALLSHADRSRIACREDMRRVFTKGALLVDGFLVGRWDVKRARSRATLNVELFRRLAKAESAVVTEEGERLLRFVATEGDAAEILVR